MQQQVEKLDGQARAALAANREDLAREALARKAAVQAQLESIMQPGPAARSAAGEAGRGLADAAGEDRGLPHAEGSHQGAVLGSRGAGEDRRSRIRDRRAHGRRRPVDPAREGQDRADAGPRRAIDELTAAGTLEDYTSQGDDLDRQLSQISQGSQVDSELAKMKAELGTGAEPPALEGGASEAEAPAAPEVVEGEPQP